MKEYPARKTRKFVEPNIWLISRLYVEDMFPLDHPVRPIILGWIRSRTLPKLAELASEIVVQHDDPACEWIKQVMSFFKKNDAFSSDECEETARRNFETGESLCRRTNRRVDFYSRYPERLDAELREDLQRIRRNIRMLLGDESTLTNSWLDWARLTSGATEDRSRKRSLPFLKVTGKLRAPAGSMKYLKEYTDQLGCELDELVFTPVEVNRVEFVPKNWKTFRAIACEPTHVLPLQLAAGNYITHKLKQWNIDLTDQTLNQEKARLGSIDGSLATIDLSMASDTLSINTVFDLLPSNWACLLNDLRSKGYRSSENGVHRLHAYSKFSSMGNGFTFPLETLIFTAACLAVGSSDYQVYGDDIIIETQLVPRLMRLLKYIGFRTNEEKSFYEEGAGFRESCGCDWYKGKLVTPVYLRNVPRTRSSLSHLINSLVAVAQPYGALVQYLVSLVRKNRLAVVPFNSDTQSGVFVDVTLAYHKGLIRKELDHGVGKPYCASLVYKGYAPKTKNRKNIQYRAFLTWFLTGKAFDQDASFLNKRSSRLYGVEHPARLLSRLAWQYSDWLKTTRRGRAKSGSSLDASKVPLRTTYSHSRAIRFVPVRNKCPSEYFLFGEVLLGKMVLPGSSAA